jgi:Bacterial EndoU nuclease
VLGPEILVNVPAPPATGTVDGPGSYVPLPGTIFDDGPGSFVPPPFGPGGLIVDAAAPDQPTADPPPVDVNGQWGAANGEKPDPESIAIGGSRAHILYGDGDDDGGGHRFDSGVPGKTVFPEDWGDDRITDNILDVARNPENPPVFNERRGVWTVSGVREGVAIDVIVKPDGGIITGHPTGGPGVHRNDVNGDPQPI